MYFTFQLSAGTAPPGLQESASTARHSTACESNQKYVQGENTEWRWNDWIKWNIAKIWLDANGNRSFQKQTEVYGARFKTERGYVLSYLFCYESGVNETKPSSKNTSIRKYHKNGVIYEHGSGDESVTEIAAQ